MHASERDTPRVQAERARYRDLSATLDLRRVKFIDESGINIAMTRLYGRAPRGERALACPAELWTERHHPRGARLHGAGGRDDDRGRDRRGRVPRIRR